MSLVTYPYMPEGRAFGFVPAMHPHMQAAKRAQEDCAGDSLFPVGIVLVKEDVVVARAGNGYNLGSGARHVCPRVVLECASGTGYELCHLHDAPGHAEPQLMQAAHEQGIDPFGCDVYMYGHWWCCEPCWKTMIDAGIARVYLLENAHEVFSRDAVFGRTLTLRVQTGSLQISDPELAAVLQGVLENLGLRLLANEEVYITDTPKEEGFSVPTVIFTKKTGNEPVFRENPEGVYQVAYETPAQAARYLSQILKQL